MNSKQIATVAVNALEEIKGENIVIVNTSNLSPLFNLMIICTGNSNRQVAALAHKVIQDFKQHGIKIVGTEGKKGGEWVLVDSGEVVIHIMLPQVRSYYDLETLWQGDNSAR